MRRLDSLGGEIESRRLTVHELDVVLLEGRSEGERDVLRAAFAERKPDEGGVEHELVRCRHDLDVDVTVEFVFHREGRSQPAEVASEHEDLLARHTDSLRVADLR